ncbi:cysteine--tRNA ligase [Kordiimonas sp. SCSIO 12610]|uniref:cysteine--tRNA ligase n=1 Tax=Kordiimonas sp. SCSIO 12610 TaxID=2829597 RepID=UPI00210C5C8F|nr:cysteine--tRNA ligase [Kordiimonas sp. SCSIO 12610]UTW54135.1 cysteine--tRNA ligase [Kordiimonas sp. SCSIO 12610]
MTGIYVYNTLAREKQKFEPIDPENVRMYVCGPTVYDYAHVGNARPVVVFDTLFRLLRHTYGDDQVKFAANFTDIDDRIMAKAVDEGVSIRTISNRYAKAYLEDMGALGILNPTLRPKATEHIPEMIKMMRALIEKGHAYEAEGHVMFHVPSMENYGRLSNHSRDELVAGARVEVAPYKKDPADFVLWKPSSENQVGWGSPWGRGRPGWHLECSCMIEKHFGETIDIHGGGQDLIFPHHENEIAQSECTHGETFVKYWMHNGYLTVDGEKMSKSLGNFHTVHDLLGDGYKGEAIRMALLSAHYRQPVDFSLDALKEQKRRLDKWYRLTDGVEAATDVPSTVIDALSDDLNTPKAFAALDALANVETAAELKAGLRFMGLLNVDATEWFQGDAVDGVDAAEIEALIGARNTARANKDFAESDRIRDELLAKGIILEDAAGKTTWRKA